MSKSSVGPGHVDRGGWTRWSRSSSQRVDTYRRVGDAWRTSGRSEHTLCMTGGRIADLMRSSLTGGGPTT